MPAYWPGSGLVGEGGEQRKTTRNSPWHAQQLCWGDVGFISWPVRPWRHAWTLSAVWRYVTNGYELLVHAGSDCAGAKRALHRTAADRGENLLRAAWRNLRERRESGDLCRMPIGRHDPNAPTCRVWVRTVLQRVSPGSREMRVRRFGWKNSIRIRQVSCPAGLSLPCIICRMLGLRIDLTKFLEWRLQL